MGKTPGTRHSKPNKEPVTIDLPPGDVSRVKAEAESAGTPADRNKKAAGRETAAAAPATDSPASPFKPQGSDTPSDSKSWTKSPSEAAKEGSGPAQPTGSAASAAAGAFAPKPSEAGQKASDAAKPATDAPKPSPSASTASTQAPFGKDDRTAAPQPRRAGFGTLLGASIIGAVVALLLAFVAQTAGIWPNSTGTSEADGARIGDLEADIADLRNSVDALATPGDTASLGEQVTAQADRIAALGSRLDELQAAYESLDPGGDAAPVDLSGIEERIAAVEAGLAEAPQSGASGEEIAGLAQRLDGLAQDVGSAREAAEATGTRIAEVEGQIADLSARMDEVTASGNTALVIAGSALRSAVDRGGSFTAELEAYAALAPDAAGIEPLRAYAEQGVDSREALEAGFDGAAAAMIAAGRPADPDAGFFERLWDSAQGMVTVRPIGSVEGEGVPAIVARMEAALKGGDLAAALREYDGLPQAAQEAGADFAQRLRARHEAEQLVEAMLADAPRA